MSLQAIGNFFKKIGVDIKKVITYLPTLEVKFTKAVKDAQSDTAETITTGKPFISAVAVASANIAAAAAIEKEGLDITGDLK